MTAPRVERTRDAGWEAHRVAVAHLEACAEAEDVAEETGDLTVDSPAVAPWCGCTDCVVRETLAAAWPILLDDAAALLEGAGHTAAATLIRAETARVRQAMVTSPSA